MSELGSVVDSLRMQVLADLSDAAIEEVFLELNAGVEQLELERLRMLADLDRRRLFARDGFLSTEAWLVGACRMAPGAAHEQVRAARALEVMPETNRALEEGEISLSGAKALVAAQVIDPAAFEEVEAAFVEAARIHTVRDLQRMGARFREQSEKRASTEELRQRREFHAWVSASGMVRLDGNLDPETGESVMTALESVLDAEARHGWAEDTRTPAQRKADALAELCRQWLDRRDRPTVAGERPHITVTVPLGALRGENGKVPEFDHVGPVGIDAVLRLACDASVSRVVMAGPSEPLDVGRRTPVVSPALRRAVVARDRHCTFPGCHRPPPWCDVHHIKHWADGGETSLENLTLLCRRHHTLVHGRGPFTLRLEDGRRVFRRADGSVVEDRSPPSTQASDGGASHPTEPAHSSAAK